MKKVLIIEDYPDILKKLLDLFLPMEYGDSFEPEWDVTICTTEEGAKTQYPGFFDYILIDHDLPDRGNGGRVLNSWNNVCPWISVKGNTKIIAISSVPVNNERLLGLGANIAIDKMDLDFLDKLKKELEIK